jgi:hypothetical protein
VSTKRIPLRRDLRRQVTPAAIAAFARMEAATTDDEWWAAHAVLHAELGLKPWQWPAFEYPDEPCPYPAFSVAAKKWRSDRAERPEAFELYRALIEAAGKP